MHTGIDGTFGIEGVEDGLDEESVHPTLDKSVSLFHISLKEFIVGYLTSSGVADIWRHRQSLVGRSDGTCHKTGLLISRELISHPTGYPRTFESHQSG